MERPTVERDSGPCLESEKVKDNKENGGEISSTAEGGKSEVVSFAVSGNGAESEDVFGERVQGGSR